MSIRQTRQTIAATALLAVVACSDRPQAPPLTAEAVFHNDQIGLRFLVPAGWAVQARANLPVGTLTKPIVVVSYQRVGGEKPADFKLLAADLPADTNLEQFLVDYRVGSDTWTSQAPARPVVVNSEPATRHVLTRTEGKDEFHREVTAFRRGDRVYFFIVAFAASDASSRDAVRVSIGSVIWTK